MRPASFSRFSITIPCYCPTRSFQLGDSDARLAFHLQRDFETDLLSVVTEDAPGGAEEDETDPGPALENLLLQTHITLVSFSSTCQHLSHFVMITFSCSSPERLSFLRNFSLHFLWVRLTLALSSVLEPRGSSHANTKSVQWEQDHFQDLINSNKLRSQN